ncbi:hypothetical protein [Halorarius litoreus]|uniref:hypothetical protein n=1 Tax=Halorarius litoreus TaxID=2962676 RepID=UPI0020CD2F03|nr:hypothetical protein [Halorarius litoreus]
MDKRQLAANLILGALLFVGVAHTLLATLVFDTGLEEVGVLLIGVVLVGFALVNL